MTKINMLANKHYENGQTDGMKLFKKETKNSISYTFAANRNDAELHFKTGIVAEINQVVEYLKKLR